MFCALCLEEPKDLRPIEQLHRDIFAKIGIAIPADSTDQWICNICEEDIEMRRDNLDMQIESNQLNEFLGELQAKICHSPTKSSINWQLQTESKQLNTLINEIEGNLCKSPRKYVGGNHDEKEIKIEKFEIDEPEEFLCDDENLNSNTPEEHVLLEATATTSSRIIFKKSYTNAAENNAEDCTIDDFNNRPFTISTSGDNFSDSSGNENEFLDNNVDDDDDRNALATTNTTSSHESDHFTILKSKRISISSVVEPFPEAATNQNQDISDSEQSDFLDTFCHLKENNSFSMQQHGLATASKHSQYKKRNIFKYKNAYRKIGTLYVCKLCTASKKFLEATFVRQHIEHQHFNLRFQCLECKQKYVNIALLREHCAVKHHLHVLANPKRLLYKKSEKPVKKISEKCSMKINKKRKRYKRNVAQSKTTQRCGAVLQQPKKPEIFEKSAVQSKTSQSGGVTTAKHLLQQHKKSETFDNSFVSSNTMQSDEATTTKTIVQQSKKPVIQGAFAKFYNRVNGYYYCNECADSSYRYGSLHAVKNHIQVNHMGYRYICTECDNRLTSLKNIKKHYQRAHNIANGNIVFEIPKGKNPHDPSTKYSNVIEKVGNSYHCLICTETPKYNYANEMYLRLHIRIYHYGYRYICTECDDAKYTNSGALKNHYSKVHNKKDGIIKFDIPKNKEENFNENPKKFRHGYKKINGNYHCQLCTESEKKFTVSGAALGHIKSFHFGFRYACAKCSNIQFVDKRQLQQHCANQHSKNSYEKLELIKILNKKVYEDFMAKRLVYPMVQPILNNEDYHKKEDDSSSTASALKNISSKPKQSDKAIVAATNLSLVSTKSIQNAEESSMADSQSKQTAAVCAQKDKAIITSVTIIQNADKCIIPASKSNQTIADISQPDKPTVKLNVLSKSVQNAEKSKMAASTTIQNKEQRSNSMVSTVNMATKQTTNSSSSCHAKSSKSFKRHFEQVGKSFRCKLCTKSQKFSKISDVKEHIEFEHFELGYHLCIECDRIFESERKLDKHNKRRHGNIERPLKLKQILNQKADSKRAKQNLQHSQNSDDVSPEENQDLQQENTISISDKTTAENNISSSSTVDSHQAKNNKDALDSSRPLKQLNSTSKSLTSTSPQNSPSKSILKVRVKQLSLDAWLKTTNKAEQQKITDPKEAQSSQARKKLSLVDWLKTPKKAQEQQKSTNPKETQSSQAVKKCKRPRSPDRADSISSQPSPVKQKRTLNKKNTKSPQSNSAVDQTDSISPQSNTTEPNSPPKQLSSASNEETVLLQPTLKNNKFDLKNKYKKVGNLYCCLSCSHKSKTHEALFAHIKSQHYGYRYFCNYCNDNFVNKRSVDRHCKSVHKKEHSDPISFRIPKSEELKEPPQFNFDDKIKKVNNFYVCTECSQQYKLSPSLRDHIKTKHYGYRYFCNYCDAQFTQKVHLQRHCRGVHKKEHSGPLIFRKPKSEELKKPAQFNFDNKIKKVNNFYVCTECSQKYKQQQALREHIKSKHYGYRYFCHYCDMHCAQKAAVERHCQRAHKKAHSDPIIFRTPNPEELKEPEEINFDNAWKKINDWYVCSLCPAASAMKATATANLRLHIKIHHYNYRYYCSECNANYLTSTALKRHYKKQHNISDGIIKYEKPKSTDAATTTSTPIAALRTKTYKPLKFYDYTNKYKKVGNHYVCTVCKNSKKKYTDAPHIRQHIKFDHYGYRYICKKCNMSWYGINGIKSHNLKVHNVKDGPLIFARIKKPKKIVKSKIDYTNTYKKNAEKSYDCLLCNTAPFSFAASVARHIKVEHYGYRYKCAKCPVQLFSRAPLEMHYRRAHRIKSGSIIFERVARKATHKIKFKVY